MRPPAHTLSQTNRHAGFAALLIIALVLTATPGASPLAQSDVYKWVDTNGKVHYSGDPPLNTSGTPIGTATRIDSTNVSTYHPDPATVYSNIPPAPGTAAAPGYQVSSRPGTQSAPQPSNTSNGFGPSDAQLAAWRAQCEREMWADCDDPRALITRYGGAVYAYPPVVVLGGALRAPALNSSRPAGATHQPATTTPQPNAPIGSPNTTTVINRQRGNTVAPIKN